MMKRPSLTPAHAKAVTAVLGVLSLFPPLATDMYLSAMGVMAEEMNASHATAELSLSLFFLGLCVGQLGLGLLIDGFGRKGPLVFGVVLFVVTSLALPLVGDVGLFIALRFLQAIGASAGMVIGRAIVTDLYEGRQAAKVMTVLVMLLTIGPIISPTLGSVLLETFGWRSIFAAMALIGVVALVLSVLILPETLPAPARRDSPVRSGIRAAGALLSRWAFLRAAVIAGLVQGGMFAFITGSSGVFQGVFGLSPIGYGLLFALIACALVVFGRINTKLLDRFQPRQIIGFALPAYVAAAGCLVLVSGSAHLWVFVLPLWLSIGMVGLLSANAMAITMAQARDTAGVGSALLGAVQFGIAFGVSSCVALAGNGTALPMSLGLLIPASLALLLSRIGGKPAADAPEGLAGRA